MRYCSAISLILLSTLVYVYGDPQILSLEAYLNGTVYTASGVEDGANLYVASNDDPVHLNNIKVMTGGNTYLLSDLAAIQPDGTSIKIMVNGGLQISTMNPDSVTDSLTGYLYITTAQQAQDASFGVYVITGSHNIVLSAVQTTTVILNTQLKVQSGEADQPQKSTYVQNIQMTKNENLTFQWGVPSANYKQDTSTQFFMNPFSYPDKNGVINRLYFNNVEPLQVALDAWYIISSGPVTLSMRNNYVPNQQTTATSINTTGLLVTNNYLFNQHTVNLLDDPTHSRTVGTLLSVYATPLATVSFAFNGTDGSFVQTYDKSRNATQNLQAKSLSPSTFTVKSTDITAGIFYCQYFSISTTPTASTTTHAAPPTGTSQTAGSTGQTNAPVTGSTVTRASGATAPVTSRPTVTTMSPGIGSTSTIGTTTSSVRSLSILSVIVITLLMFFA